MLYTSLICICLAASTISTALPVIGRQEQRPLAWKLEGGRNLQTFEGTLGSIAPAVYENAERGYATYGGAFIFPADALNSSCHTQRRICYGVTNSAACTRQLYACLTHAATVKTTSN